MAFPVGYFFNFTAGRGSQDITIHDSKPRKQKTLDGFTCQRDVALRENEHHDIRFDSRCSKIHSGWYRD